MGHDALHRLAAEFPRMLREAEDKLIERVGPPSFGFERDGESVHDAMQRIADQTGGTYTRDEDGDGGTLYIADYLRPR